MKIDYAENAENRLIELILTCNKVVKSLKIINFFIARNSQ